VIGNNVVVIKNIPAEVCTQCNEPIMSSTVSQHIDKLLKQARRSGFEVSIVAYSQPAMAEV
jgi:peptide subunit release factor 1 (eRF1)